MREPQLFIDNGSFYLIQDISGLTEYEKAKAITKFVGSSTKILEYHLETEINTIFSNNNIKIPNNDKNSVRMALNELNSKYKRIEITDLFGGKEFYRCKKITTTKSKMTVIVEEDNYIECGVRVSEGKI